MSDRKIDRQAWAELVGELIRSHTRGKNAPFARLVQRDTRTVTRWLSGDVDVSEESVRAVARALELNPAELLVRVGYYQPEEVYAQAPLPDPMADPELRAIMDQDDLDEDLKNQIIEVVLQRRGEDLARRQSDVQRMIELARRQSRDLLA